jgi:hypothetical protein
MQKFKKSTRKVFIQFKIELEQQFLSEIQRRTSSLSQEFVKREEIQKDRSITVEKLKNSLKQSKIVISLFDSSRT